jgi:hypothetical protein
MGKIVIGGPQNISLDGVVQDPTGEETPRSTRDTSRTRPGANVKPLAPRVPRRGLGSPGSSRPCQLVWVPPADPAT